MTLAAPFRPSTELVARAWLSTQVPGVDPGMVATTLPRDVGKWAETGFAQVQSIVAGRYDPNGTKRSGLVQIDTWAVAVKDGTVSTSKIPWGKASALMEAILGATENDAQTFGLSLDLGNYGTVRVLAVYPTTEPTRISGDGASAGSHVGTGYARYSMDLAVDWVRS